MRFSTIIAAATFALSAAAAPAAGKSFKLGITVPGKETLYLTASGAGVPNKDAGTVNCVIESGKIACNGKGLGWTGHEMAHLVPGNSNSHNEKWSIGANDEITWGAGPRGPMKFSLVGKEMWAQDCGSHPDARMFTVGKAKAYYV